MAEDMKETFSTKSAQFLEEKRQTTTEIEDLKMKLNNQEIMSDGLIRELNEAQLKISSLNTNIFSLEQYICVNDDTKQQLAESHEKVINLWRNS